MIELEGCQRFYGVRECCIAALSSQNRMVHANPWPMARVLGKCTGETAAKYGSGEEDSNCPRQERCVVVLRCLPRRDVQLARIGNPHQP